jgi:hypothetical protein
MIDINKIIKINLEILENNIEELDIYKTAVYLYPSSDDIKNENKLYSSYSDVEDDYYDNDKGKIVDDGNLCFNLKQYFKNGGNRIVVCPVTNYTKTEFIEIITEVRKIVNDFIFVVVSSQCIGESKYNTGIEETESENKIIDLAKYCESLKSPNVIRLCFTTNSKTFIDDNGLNDYSTIIKYSSSKNNNYMIDTALLVPAYFSGISLSEYSSFKDYCYTKEKLYDVDDNGICNLTSDEYDQLVDKYNFIDKIGNNILNFGGNCSNGIGLTLEFGMIALENDIAYNVLESIIDKQYLTANGLTNVVSIINSTLQKYVSNGFIQENGIYDYEKYIYSYNGKKYTIINKNEAMEKGYKIYPIPISNISSQDYKDKKFPPIVIVVKTNNGARIVEINGVIG